MPTSCVLVLHARALLHCAPARPPACLYSPAAAALPCRAVRIAGGVAFGSTSLHTARSAREASERASKPPPPSAGPGAALPLLPPASPVRSRRYGTGGILLRVGVGTVPRGSARVGRSTDAALLLFSCSPAGFWSGGRPLCFLKPPAGASSARLPSVLPSGSHAWSPGTVVKLTQRRKKVKPPLGREAGSEISFTYEPFSPTASLLSLFIQVHALTYHLRYLSLKSEKNTTTKGGKKGASNGR